MNRRVAVKLKTEFLPERFLSTTDTRKIHLGQINLVLHSEQKEEEGKDRKVEINSNLLFSRKLTRGLHRLQLET